MIYYNERPQQKELRVLDFIVKIGVEEFISDYMGHKEEDIHRLIQKRYKLVYDIPSMTDNRIQLFLEEVKQLTPFSQVVKEIKNTSGERFILSSQKEDVIVHLLKQWNLYDYFKNRIISCPNRGVKKQDVLTNPIYYFGCPENEITLYEDSLETITFAQSIGIYTVGVIGSFNRTLFGKEIGVTANRVLDVSL